MSRPDTPLTLAEFAAQVRATPGYLIKLWVGNEPLTDKQIHHLYQMYLREGGFV